MGVLAIEAVDRVEPAEIGDAEARAAGFETRWLKVQVRSLKELGLTESLKTGYRLSPRGCAFVRARRSGFS